MAIRLGVWILGLIEVLNPGVLIAQESGPARVLIVGDSHTAFTFGRALHENLLSETGIRPSTFASCGSKISHWLNGGWSSNCGFWSRSEGEESHYWQSGHPTPRLGALLDEVHPSHVVIALGSNHLWRSPGLDNAEEEIRQTIAAVKARGAQCLWIGPPRMLTPTPAQVERFYRALRGIASRPEFRCHVVDSRNWTRYPTGSEGDGTHYDRGDLRDTARSWARQSTLVMRTWVRATIGRRAAPGRSSDSGSPGASPAR